MKTTTDTEISIVKERLKVLEGNISAELEAQLLTKTPRLQQHGLFWLLIDDRTFVPIEKSLNIVKEYAGGRYYKKAISKLLKEGDSIQYKANVAEMITAAYYMDKFKGDDTAVTWERRILPSRNSVDITLNNYKTPINIEVTGLTDRKALSDFWKNRYHFKDALQPLVVNKEKAEHGVIYSFGDFNLDNGLPEVNIADFAKFINECKAKGKGLYKYLIEGHGEVEVTITNESKKEFLEDLTVWSGWMRDGLRMNSKVIEKAKSQLPKDEINFVNICNLAGMDDEDYYEAMYGQYQVTVNSAKPKEHKEGFADNGISRIIADKGYANVHGIMKSSFDYFNNDKSKKQLITNPRLKLPDEIYELVA